MKNSPTKNTRGIKLLFWLTWPMLILIMTMVVTVVDTTAILADRQAINEPTNRASSLVRRTNVPYLEVAPPNPYSTRPAIFWFGRVDNTSNYADVRTIYDDDELRVIVHIMDRQLWYDTSPNVDKLTEWDAVTLYLNLDGATGQTPGANAYQFVAQLNHWQPRDSYQAVYRGDGTGWVPAATPFETTTGWRGGTLNNNEGSNRGWFAHFVIPFANLGVPSPPPEGTTWGLAVVVHDRDDATGTPIPDRYWPEMLLPDQPASWGEMHFGLPVVSTPPAVPTDIITIRQGLNGATVTDAHVGGHTVCGSDHWPDYFPTWGDANYAGYGQINIQNQWDIADWPCFSKYFVTFPLDIQVPIGKTFIRATLTMHQFGSAWGQSVEPSWLQVLTINENWDEATITWNNAPLAVENLSGTWAEPGSADWPGIPRTWDVSKGVIEALAKGKPLRLALYSADGAYHSGRYFSSSNTGDWNATARPTLQIVWGEPCSADGVECVYLPLVQNTSD
jgi:hypothetical protein